MNTESVEATILVNAGTGETSRKLFNYSENRLTRQYANQIRELADSTKFIKFDQDKLAQMGNEPTEEAKEQAAKGAITGMDISGVVKASEVAFDRLTIVLWGLSEQEAGSILDSDFQKMLDIVKNRDPLKINNKDTEVKKNVNTLAKKNGA